MRADMTVYQPGDFLYNLLIKKSKYVIKWCSPAALCLLKNDQVIYNNKHKEVFIEENEFKWHI